MSINSAAEVTDRGWTEQDGLPPGFFYGGNANEAHLHLGLGLIKSDPNPPWEVKYIGFRAGSSRIVIYDPSKEINNRAAIQSLPATPNRTAAQVQEQAMWAYDRI